MVLPAADPAHQQGVVHGKLNDGVQLLGPLVQQVIQLRDTQAGGQMSGGRTAFLFVCCCFVVVFLIVEEKERSWQFSSNTSE